MLSRLVAGLRKSLPLARFKEDARGNVAIMFAFSLIAITVAVGGAMDLGRAYTARQKLYEVATLACQYASRPSVSQTDAASYSGSNGQTAYASKVASFITVSLASQNFPYTQATGTPFTSTQNGPANVNLSANVPTTFMQIAGVTQMPISASVHCYDTLSSVPPIVPNGNSTTIVQEGFENSGCTGTCWIYYPPTGTPGTTRSTSLSIPPTTVGYTGKSGVGWIIMGFCLEVDAAGLIESSDPEGTHSAELDCDNGSGSAGNSSISTQVYLPAGNYELRWNYASRVDYPDYDPVYLCGSSASDLSWANDANASDGGASNVLRTNQINVYLDLNSTGSPPTHTTMDGNQTLGGSNLIDMCVYSPNWIERSVRIDATTAGWYWLSFAADGQNDSYGGQIDNIRLCPETCPGTPQDNFPASWLTSTNLFEDTFESPTYTANSGSYIANNGNMNSSLGTSGASNDGWPSLAASGWATAPYNQMDYNKKSPDQGSQAIELDATSSGSMTTSNRLISRPFLLDPGYYQLSYDYISDAQFSTLSSVYCGATPAAANISSLTGSHSATLRIGGTATVNLDSNIVGVFMSHAQEASTPIGGGSLKSTTSYTNPDSTTSTTPTVAPDGLSLTSYNSAQVNPLLDICGYAASWQSRTAAIQITKPAYYWLTFSAKGTADSYGGAIDDVKLTALGSPAMSSPPASPVMIPVPAPVTTATTTTTVSYTGFSIVANPQIFPAPTQ